MIITLSLDNFRITETRALHNDTDFVTVSIKVGDADAITKTQAMGDVNNGTHDVGLGVSADIKIDADVPVAFSYLILNNGHGNPSDVQKGIQSALSALGTAGTAAAAKAVGKEIAELIGAALGTAAVPIVGSALGALSAWAVIKVGSVLFANCDGTVAAGISIYSSKQLVQNAISGNKITGTTEHKGLTSQTGCGSNSHYFTTSTISALVTEAVRLRNHWKSDQVVNIESGALMAGPIDQGALSARWTLEPVPDADLYRIRNVWKPDQYLNIENGPLIAGPIDQGELSAMWAIEPVT
jgi:hypothetical protein